MQRLQRLTHTAVYLDGGHSHWQFAAEMATRLKADDVRHADGFFLNVSNFRGNAELIRYGKQVSRRISGKHFVIDTSRNGQGPWTGPPDPEWGLTDPPAGGWFPQQAAQLLQLSA